VNPYDETPDDYPVDVSAVGADDAAIERLRHALSPDDAVVWDDNDDEVDPALGLLRAFQRDVANDLPADEALLPAEVTPLVGHRRLGRGAVVAAIAASVLSIGGVAAAASTPGHLAGVRAAVASAVTSVIDAITPDAPVGPKAQPAAHRTVDPSPTGTSTAGPEAATAPAQLAATLDKAERFLDNGQYTAAREQLDSVARRLDRVSDETTRDRLAVRLAALRTRLAGAHPERSARGDHGKGGSGDGAHGGDASTGPHAGDGNTGTGSSRDGRPGGSSDGSTGRDGSQPSSGTGSSGHDSHLAPTQKPATEAPHSDRSGSSAGAYLRHDSAAGSGDVTTTDVR
jgi:hypothetical protein